ncbi:UV-B-induced protein [Sesbania bispinosa]|nr:UV-B-induced protein [Sesbania bispinosa]
MSSITMNFSTLQKEKMLICHGDRSNTRASKVRLIRVFNLVAFGMTQNLLSLILGEQLVSHLQTIIQIREIKLKKLYDASKILVQVGVGGYHLPTCVRY